ncbi:MAG TPA: hypothetical protein VGR21_02235 [Cryptosporangiaceae bacterium]|nr:hypothetical protein [Cryptosporangiaceae bacterium]
MPSRRRHIGGRGGERYVIERNVTPMAALVPLSDLADRPPRQRGLAALVGAFTDAPELPDVLTETAQTRNCQRTRPAPGLQT